MGSSQIFDARPLVKLVAILRIAAGLVLFILFRCLILDSVEGTYEYRYHFGPVVRTRKGHLSEILGVFVDSFTSFEPGTVMIYRMVSVTWSRRRLLPFPIKYLFFSSLEQAEDPARQLAIILATKGFRLGESAY